MNPTNAMVNAVDNKADQTPGLKEGIEKPGSPSGTAPTIFMPCSVNPKPQTASIPNTTATSEVGIPLWIFFPYLMTIMPTTPMANVSQWVCPMFSARANTMSWICSVFGRLSRNKCFNWLNPMMMAAAEVKPLMTGCDRKLTKKPSRNNPMPNCSKPTNKAVVIAYNKYSSGEAGFSAPIPAAVSKDTIATGPTANCLEVPKTAYNIKGIVTA